MIHTQREQHTEREGKGEIKFDPGDKSKVKSMLLPQSKHIVRA